jgi:hypothetical protein
VLSRAGCCALALLAAAPSIAAAQFTTVIRPPERQEAVPTAAEVAARDSVATLQITSMQAWVDSVAAEAAAQGDTIVAEVSAGAVVTDSAELVAARSGSTTSFRDGASAPDTATPLPLLLLSGLLAVGLGGVLLHKPRA